MNASTDRPAAKSTGWHRQDTIDLSIIGATHGLSDGFSGMLKPVLALIVIELGLSTFEAGALLSAFSVATFLFLYPLSVVADFGGRKKELLLIGLSITTLAFLLMQWTTTFAGLALLAFFAGMGNATFHPCGTSLTAERFAQNRSYAVSVFSMMGNAGASLMPVLQAFVASVAGWRLAISISAAPALLLLPLLGMRFHNQEIQAYGRELATATSRVWALTRRVFQNRAVLLLATIYALTGMSMSVVSGFLSLLAWERFALGTGTVGFALSVYFFAGVLAKPVMGYLYDQWGARTALLAPLLLSGLLTMAVALVPWQGAFIPLLALLGMTSPISPIILIAAADRSEPEVLASSVGFIYTCFGLGFVSPLIGGLLAEAYSLTLSYLFAAVLLWIGAAVTLLLDRQRVDVIG